MERRQRLIEEERKSGGTGKESKRETEGGRGTKERWRKGGWQERECQVT